jgi:two-component system, chemotaxis family, chemotaxis protein CheY
MKVLIVDDSRVLRMHLGIMMRGMGWQTDEAENGARALERLRADGSYELVLMDVNMPEMNGIECVRRLRRELPGLTTKLMMVTTEADFGLIADVLDNGADEFLMKPFTRENLQAKLQLMSLPIHP